MLPEDHDAGLPPARETTGAELGTAQAALRKSEETLRLVFENAREYAIISTDLQCLVTSWNTGAERLLGYTEQEILGQKAAIMLTPEVRASGLPEEEERLALAEGRATHECWHQRKDGGRFWGSGVLTTMYDAHGQPQGFVKVFRDRTDERRADAERARNRAALQAALQEAERARAEAEAASRAKDRFLSVLSHELRTPLTPVTMAAHLLSRRHDLPEGAREAVAMIQRNVLTETQMIDELLDISRISRGKLEIVRAPLDLRDAVRRAVEISTDDMHAKKQSLTVTLAAGEHQLEGDAGRLQQVFWNLLKNASKFTPEGGAIRVESRDGEPGRIVVEIADTGIGFEPEAATRIFESFAQADENITRQFGGLGLGLAISKAAVDAHGGTLQARSAGPGQGATFTVTLPLSR